MPVLSALVLSSLILLNNSQVPDQGRVNSGPPLPKSIQVGGAIPGVVMAFGKDASVVAVAQDGNSTRPAIVITKYGKGFATAMGHSAVFDGFIAESEGALITYHSLLGANAKVGFIGNPIPKAMEESAPLWKSYPNAEWKIAIRESGAIVIGNSVLTADPLAAKAIDQFVKSGGFLIALDTPWGWKQLNPGKSIAKDHPLQKLLAPMGIGFADGYLDTDKGAMNLKKPSPLHDIKYSKLAFEGSGTLTESDARVVSDTLMSAISDLQDGLSLKSELKKMIGKQGDGAIPTSEKPIKSTDFRTRLAMAAFNQSWRALPADQVKAHPASQNFPGAVGQKESREEATISIGGGKKNWWSTGRYAAPGEKITVKVGANLAIKNLRLRIGGHTDELWHLDQWQRFPSISQVVALTNGAAEAANPFGGLVYIEAEQSLPLDTVLITGTVAAPTYFLGKTSDAEWVKLRNMDVPWGEIVGNQCAISVPSSVLKNLKNPKEIAEYWDEVLRSAEGFFAVKPGSTEHRYQADRQISAGYMHSGYPIMTWLDVQEKFVDISVLRGKDGGTNWGFYHELGHNYQESEWTWDGWGETTNNLFSLFACAQFNGDTKGHGAMAENEVLKRINLVAGKPGAEDYFQKDPWFGLTFWVQIQREFGFSAVTKFFAIYQAMRPNERPRGDQARMDAFVVNMSKVIGRDISGYAKKWGMPVSAGAIESVKGLPVWMP